LGKDAIGYLVTNLKMKTDTSKLYGAFLSNGGYAQYAWVRRESLINCPSNMEPSDFASLPTVWLLAFKILHYIARPQPGDWVFISAGGSGVGSALIQLASKVYKANVIASVSSQEKASQLKQLGATFVINSNEISLEEDTNTKNNNLIN